MVIPFSVTTETNDFTQTRCTSFMVFVTFGYELSLVTGTVLGRRETKEEPVFMGDETKRKRVPDLTTIKIPLVTH